MTENLELPDPAPKGFEQEKWKAMVDSVIEFISASRIMLQVLTERIKDNEKFREEEKQKADDEKTKLAFYKECLNLEIAPNKESKPVTMNSKDSGDGNHDKTTQKTCCHHKKHAHPHGDKDAIGEKMNNNQNSTSESKANESKVSTESQYVSVEEHAKKAMPVHQSGGTISKCHKASRIPRTKSVYDDKQKSLLIDQTLNEGENLGKSNCTKKCIGESTYSTLHQKNRFLKSESVSKL